MVKKAWEPMPPHWATTTLRKKMFKAIDRQDTTEAWPRLALSTFYDCLLVGQSDKAATERVLCWLGDRGHRQDVERYL